jgi:hypothetical protein
LHSGSVTPMAPANRKLGKRPRRVWPSLLVHQRATSKQKAKGA